MKIMCNDLGHSQCFVDLFMIPISPAEAHHSHVAVVEHGLTALCVLLSCSKERTLEALNTRLQVTDAQLIGKKVTVNKM